MVGRCCALLAFDKKHRNRDFRAQLGQIHLRRRAVAVQAEEIQERSQKYGSKAAIELELDKPLKEWYRSNGQWYEDPSQEQKIFLASEPAMAAFGRLLEGESDALLYLTQRFGGGIEMPRSATTTGMASEIPSAARRIRFIDTAIQRYAK